MKNEKKKTKIKVIKKDDIGISRKKVVETKDPQEATRRKLVSTISEWVEDLKKSRFKDAEEVIDRFYKNHPQNA